ncbi:hypothetical protein, partial [Mesorhizobium sp.]|uniref:hypothetical protein n=1 Tax=Mesorhizobium sp. TaxID=1871066 RepID=UPI0025F4A22A
AEPKLVGNPLIQFVERCRHGTSRVLGALALRRLAALGGRGVFYGSALLGPPSLVDAFAFRACRRRRLAR